MGLDTPENQTDQEEEEYLRFGAEWDHHVAEAHYTRFLQAQNEIATMPQLSPYQYQQFPNGILSTAPAKFTNYTPAADSRGGVYPSTVPPYQTRTPPAPAVPPVPVARTYAQAQDLRDLFDFDRATSGEKRTCEEAGMMAQSRRKKSRY